MAKRPSLSDVVPLLNDGMYMVTSGNGAMRISVTVPVMDPFPNAAEKLKNSHTMINPLFIECKGKNFGKAGRGKESLPVATVLIFLII